MWQDVARKFFARLFNGTLQEHLKDLQGLDEVESDLEDVTGHLDDEGYQTDDSMPALIY